MLKVPFSLKALPGRAARASLHSIFFSPPSLLPSCLLQAGFAAEGVESGTVFSDINLQEKVRLGDPARCCVVPGENSLFGDQGF